MSRKYFGFISSNWFQIVLFLSFGINIVLERFGSSTYLSNSYYEGAIPLRHPISSLPTFKGATRFKYNNFRVLGTLNYSMSIHKTAVVVVYRSWKLKSDVQKPTMYKLHYQPFFLFHNLNIHPNLNRFV